MILVLRCLFTRYNVYSCVEISIYYELQVRKQEFDYEPVCTKTLCYIQWISDPCEAGDFLRVDMEGANEMDFCNVFIPPPPQGQIEPSL